MHTRKKELKLCCLLFSVSSSSPLLRWGVSFAFTHIHTHAHIHNTNSLLSSSRSYYRVAARASVERMRSEDHSPPSLLSLSTAPVQIKTTPFPPHLSLLLSRSGCPLLEQKGWCLTFLFAPKCCALSLLFLRPSPQRLLPHPRCGARSSCRSPQQLKGSVHCACEAGDACCRCGVSWPDDTVVARGLRGSFQPLPHILTHKLTHTHTVARTHLSLLSSHLSVHVDATPTTEARICLCSSLSLFFITMSGVCPLASSILQADPWSHTEMHWLLPDSGGKTVYRK